MGAGAEVCARPFRLGAWTRARALSTVRAHCGCFARRDAEKAVLNDAAREALIEAADENAAEWGCPAAGRKPHAELPPHLAAMARNAARVVGLDEVPTTCPFACLQRCDPWVAELSDAASIAETYHTPIPDVLGRPLTRADVDALAEILKARADVWESDEKIAEEQRAKPPAPQA